MLITELILEELFLNIAIMLKGGGIADSKSSFCMDVVE